MSVFIQILKIIGLILLIILCICFLLFLELLFVPVFYKIDGDYKNEDSFLISVNASWLFHILSFKYRLGREKTLSFRLFGFNLLKKKSKNNNDSVGKRFSEDEVKIPNSEIHEETINGSDSDSTEDHEEELSESEENAKKKSSFYDKIKKYIKIINSNLFKRSFNKAKKNIIKIFKIILPRKWKIYGSCGFDDPSVTGSVCAISGMLIPVFGKHLNVKGDFESTEIDLSFYFKGHITIVKIVIAALKILMDKDIKRVIKLFKEA